MDMLEAVKILKLLADGIDPYTGKRLPVESPYQHPQTIRALFTVVNVLEERERVNERKRKYPDNTGKPWNKEGDQELINDFDAGMNIAAIAEKYHRTLGGIEARLVRLGKIPSRLVARNLTTTPTRTT